MKNRIKTIDVTMQGTKCKKDQVYHFTVDEVRCLERCPADYSQKEYKDIKYCTKPHSALKLTESLVINRGKRRATVKVDRLKLGSVINQFPKRVLDTTGKIPKFQKDDAGNFEIDQAACEWAAKGSAKVFGKKKTEGAFAMMANIQPRGGKAHEAFVKCRDWGYCEIQKAKLKGLSGDERAAMVEKINAKYPDCV